MAPIDTGRIEAAVAEILSAIGEDPGRAGLRDTPERVAQAYTEFFSGIGQNAAEHLADSVLLEDGSAELSELVVMRGIEFRSICEHHLLPFVGVAHVAYSPRNRIVGLGRFPRVIDTLASRPTLQEPLTEDIADTIFTALDARGVLVVLEAVHQCVTTRGSRQTHSSTVTVASRGSLSDPVARAETMALIGSQHG